MVAWWQGGRWHLGGNLGDEASLCLTPPHSRVVTLLGSNWGCWKMGQNMVQTGLRSIFMLLLVAHCVGGQGLDGVLSALQAQAGEVLVKGDTVCCSLNSKDILTSQEKSAQPNIF